MQIQRQFQLQIYVRHSPTNAVLANIYLIYSFVILSGSGPMFMTPGGGSQLIGLLKTALISSCPEMRTMHRDEICKG